MIKNTVRMIAWCRGDVFLQAEKQDTIFSLATILTTIFLKTIKNVAKLQRKAQDPEEACSWPTRAQIYFSVHFQNPQTVTPNTALTPSLSLWILIFEFIRRFCLHSNSFAALFPNLKI